MNLPKKHRIVIDSNGALNSSAQKELADWVMEKRIIHKSKNPLKYRFEFKGEDIEQLIKYLRGEK